MARGDTWLLQQLNGSHIYALVVTVLCQAGLRTWLFQQLNGSHLYALAVTVLRQAGLRTWLL